jgi:hypothetical protein
MNKSYVAPTALSASEATPGGAAPAGPVALQHREGATRSSGWTAGRITALVIGALLGLVSLVFLGSGGTVVWADLAKRDAGYVTTDVHQFSTGGSALATVRTELGSGGTGWLYAPALLDKVRIRLTPVSPGADLFVGIGPSAEVDRYLAGVNHSVISDIWTDKVEIVGGSTAASAPGTQAFWVASSSGPGARTLKWDPANGSWTVVVMNADGRPGIAVGADLGASIPALLWIGVGLLVAGAVFGAGGGLLIAGAIRRRRAGQAETV